MRITINLIIIPKIFEIAPLTSGRFSCNHTDLVEIKYSLENQKYIILKMKNESFGRQNSGCVLNGMVSSFMVNITMA